MASSQASTSSLTPEAFASFYSSVQTNALKATKTSAGLPVDISFYKSIDSNLANDVDFLQKRVLNLVGALIGLVDSKGKGKAKNVVVAGEDVVDDFHSTVVDSMDVLLEKTDICLDEYSGRLKRPTVAVAPKYESKPYLAPSLQHASHLAKPQEHFLERPDNSDVLAKPHSKLAHKYNAKVPLGYVLQKEDLEHLENEEETIMCVGIRFDLSGISQTFSRSSHPYYYETTHLQYPKHVFEPPKDISSPPGLSEDACNYVSTAQGFSELLTHLSSPSVRDIAVDLEHHSYRTYRGFLCLMQITTRGDGTPRDFIVDLLIPEIRTRMPELNTVFTDPTKIKVFHGAESDIVWLQQDFGVYVVGLFDTFHASKLLELPRHSLSTLLSLYADITPDKKYQQADWRIRPLPQEMLKYAQSDTHWLLYIYDCVRNALLDKAKSQSLLEETLQRSSITSLRVFAPETYDASRGSGPGGWDTLAKKWNKGALLYVPGDSSSASNDSAPVFRVQRNVYRAVHAWRDRVSREEDESTRYVLPNHFLFTLAESHPADMTALLAIFRNNIPAVVKRRAKELLEVVKLGVKRGLEGSVPQQKVLEEVVVEAKAVSPPAEDGGAMEVDDESKAPATVVEGLWGAPQTQSSTIPATTSSLFSTPQPQKAVAAPHISTGTSTLFGKALGASASAKISLSTSTPAKPVPNPAFQALVSRIHSTLVVVPSVPKGFAEASTSQIAEAAPTTTPALSEPATTTTSKPTMEFDPVLGMQIDAQPMSFIPSSERASRQMEDMGPIIVVGKKGGNASGGKKKRKRQQQAAMEGVVEDGEAGEVDASGEGSPDTGVESTPSTSASKSKKRKQSSSGTATPQPGVVSGEGEGEGSETFDFTTAPNILDVSSRRAQVNKKQKRGDADKGKKKDRKKGETNFFGDFPAPPKAKNEVRSGNISTTYKPS